MTENNAVIKIIAQHTKELSGLEAKFKVLGKAHVKVLNESVDLKILCGNLKKENKQLRELLDQATNDCKVAQESLDRCQRDLLEERKPSAIYSGHFLNDLIKGGDI